MLSGKVRHQVAHVIPGLPVFHAVVNPYLGIVAVGNRLPEAQQGAALGRIGPHGITTARALGMHIRLFDQVLHVVA